MMSGQPNRDAWQNVDDQPDGSVGPAPPSECPVAPSTFSGLLGLGAEALSHQNEHIAQLRENGPVVWVPQLEAFAVTSYEHVLEVLNDPDRFSSQLGDPKGPRMARRLLEAREKLAAESEEFRSILQRLDPDWRQIKLLTSADPPRHQRHRRLVNRLFTPNKVRGLATSVETLTNSLIDEFADRGHADLIAEFAGPMPLRVVAEQLGVGDADLDAFKRWADDFVFLTGNDNPTTDDIARITHTLVEIAEYFRDVLNDRRAHPTSDFIGALAQAEDLGEPISDEERIAVIAVLLGAGTETSTKLLGAGAAILAKSPTLADRLRDDPSLVPLFVEEVLRTETPVQGLYRYVRNDTYLADVALPAGSTLWVLYASANQSPDVFNEPSKIDLERPNLHDQVAFGHGIHYCVGAPLARLEGSIGLTALLDRIYPWKIEDSELERSYILHGYRRLDVSFQDHDSRVLKVASDFEASRS